MPRNASGTYSLPAGNPVEPNTVIETEWANSTMEDIGNEITNSLSRTGEGGMLAPLRFYDGTFGVPGIAWLTETSSGLYRAGAGEFWVTVLATPVAQFTTNGLLLPNTVSLTVQGNQTIGGTLGVTGAITASGGVNGNITTSSATITGGTINGTAIGGSTPAAGAFTTLSASGAFSLTGDQVQVTEGGTGATTASGARTNLGLVIGTDIPSPTGTGASGTWSINVSGNAGTVTNGVYTSGSYSNPSWITALAASKLTGTVAIANGGTNAATAADARTNLSVPSTTGSGASGTWGIDITGNAGTVTNGVYTSGSYSDPAWITGLAGSKITGNISGNAGGLSSTLAVGSGGTGQTSYTNGQLLIGNSTGNTLTKATLTAGTGISITNGNGSITIASTSSGGTVTSVDVSGGTTGLTTSGGPVTGSGTITLAGTLAVANGGTGVTSSTGSGSNVLSTSPTLVTPLLGTPTSGTLTNCTGLPISTGVSGLGTGVATFLATPSSANLASALTDKTGTGNNVFATSPTLVTPVLGTPTSGTLTNCTGLPLTTGITGTLAVANGGTGVTSSTGTGNVVLSASPTLTGTLTAAAANFSDVVKIQKNASSLLALDLYNNYASGGAATTSLHIGYADASFYGWRMTNTNDPTATNAGTLAFQRGTGAAWSDVLSLSNAGGITLNGALTYGGVTLSNAVTGTGNMVLSASPTFTGTVLNTGSQLTRIESTGGTPTGGTGAGLELYKGGVQAYNRTTPAYAPLDIDASVLRLNASNTGGSVVIASALTYGGVTLSNSVTGTGSMVLSASPTLTGTATVSNTTSNSALRVRNSSLSGKDWDFIPVTASGETQMQVYYEGTGPGTKVTFGNDGSFLVGTTTNGGVNGNAKTAIESNTSSGVALSAYASTAGAGGAVALEANIASTSSNLAIFRYSGTVVGSITTNGTTTTYGTSSDVRLKNNIADADDAGAIIDALRVRQWDWKSNGAHEAFGFIAQEEYEVYAPAVRAGDDGDEITRQWSRDDSKLVPLLVKELQSVRARLAALEA